MIVTNPGTLDLVVKSLFNDDNYLLLGVAPATPRVPADSALRETKRELIQLSRVLEQLM